MLPFRRHRLPVFALTAAVLLMAGCASLPNAPTPQQQAATDNAAQLYRQGNFDAAAQAYLALAGQHRAGREANLLLAVESYRQENAWDKAAPVLEEIASRRLDADQLQHYAVLRAEAAEARGDHANAIALSQDAATLTPAWRGRALEVRARAQAASGQPLAAVRTRLTLDASLQGFDREQNQQQILDTLGTLDRQALNTAGSQLAADDPLKPWIAQAIAKQGGALAQTLPQLNSPVGTMLPGSTREGYQPPHHVALLLPLSSPLAAAATAVRDGFLEAQRADPEGASMQVEVIDSGASVNSALLAYQQAVDAGADMAVGPLSSDAVGALFQRGQLPLKVLALNHPNNGLPPAGSAEFSLPPEAEGAQAAARMHSQGLTSAVLFIAAQGDWAARAARAFRAQFEQLGGQVLASATLDRNQVNYADAISQVLAQANGSSGIFIALGAEQGRLLVPQLRIAKVIQPLFATSHIYAAEDNPGLDRDLDGVTFCDAPWLFNAQPGLPRRADLTASLPTTVGRAARLFAFGMDAYALLPYLAWLRAHPGSYLAGATGQLTMDSFGRVQRTPVWAGFVNGIASLAGATLGPASAASSATPTP